MAEPRNKQLICNIEKSLMDRVWVVTQLEQVSQSTYVRALVLKDLQERGLIGPDVIEVLI